MLGIALGYSDLRTTSQIYPLVEKTLILSKHANLQYVRLYALNANNFYQPPTIIVYSPFPFPTNPAIANVCLNPLCLTICAAKPVSI